MDIFAVEAPNVRGFAFFWPPSHFTLDGEPMEAPA